MNPGGTFGFASASFAPDGSGGAPIRIEAESFAGVGGRGNFAAKSVAAASGGQLVQLKPGASGQVSADLALSGVAPGLYQIRIVYVDETDGNSPASVAVDGVTAGAWAFDGNAGTQVTPGARVGAGAQPGNWRSITFTDAVQVDAGSILTLAATRNGGELARIDYVELIPLAAPNAAPTDIEIVYAGGSVPENAPGAVVGTLTVIDPNSADTHTFAVSDARFEVVGGSLQLKSNVRLDFEAEPTVEVTVTATDAGGLSYSEIFSVTAADVNEAPTAIAFSHDPVSENLAGVAVGTLSASDPDAETIAATFSVTDARFVVDGVLLKLAPGVSLDFEAAATVTVRVTVTDAGGLAHSQDVTINVAGLNEAPIDLTLAGGTVAENTAGAVVGTLSGVDPDAGDSLTFSVSDSRFEVVAGQLKLADGVALNFEATPSVTVTVSATDAAGLTYVEDITVAVADGNDAPTDIALAAVEIVAGQAGAVIGALSGTDPDAGDSLTFTVTDARFEVVGGELKLKSDVSLTLGDDGLGVTVTATDIAGLSISEVFNIEVTGENLAPVFTSGPTSVTVAENSRNAATYTATDPNGPNPPLTFSIAGGADAGRFTIGADGVLAFVQRPDFEAPRDANADNVYLVTVGVSDGLLTTTRDVAVTVANVAETFTTFRIEAEAFTGVGAANNFQLETIAAASGGHTVRLAANRTGSVTADVSNFGLVPGQYTARIVYIDETDGTTPATFRVDGNIVGNWTFDGISGTQVITGERPGTNTQAGNYRSIEFNTPFTLNANSILTLGAVQNGSESARIDYIELRPVEGPNFAPNGIALNGNPVAENSAGAVVGTLVVDDPENLAAHSFTVADSRFEVVGTTLRLKAGVSLNYEAAPVVGVSVTATDIGGLSVTQVVNVAVADQNEGPTGITLVPGFVTDEQAGAVAGTLLVADPDAGENHTYTLSDSRFEVVGGQLKLKDGISLDFPAVQSVEVTVTATDKGGLTATQTFTIGVNAPPTDLNVAGPLTVVENSAGASFGAVTVVDANVADVHTYTLSDARFEVVGGILKLKDGVALDFEAGANVNVSVTATDRGGLSITEGYVIAVGNLNETASLITLSPAIITENARRVTVGTLSSNDPDAGDSVTYSTEDQRFTIDGDTLRLTSNFFDFEQASVINLQVTVTDAAGATYTQTVPITILDVNEAPVIGAGPATVTIREGFTAVATYQGLDVDAGAVLSYFIVSDTLPGGANSDRALFTIDAQTGALSFITGRDFETPADLNQDNIYRVTIGVSDGTFTGTKAIEVTVADVQEAGSDTLFTRKIDFTPATSAIAEGYLADTGEAYNDADGYGWVTEASVADGTTNGTIPDAINVYGNEEIGAVYERANDANDLRLTTYAHFEFPRAPDSSAGAWAWEHALTNGTYIVKVAIGDTGGQNDSFNVLNIEGENVLAGFQPVGTFKSVLVTTVVTVTDGRLTLDSIGGENTEIQYLEIEQLADQTPTDGNPVEADYAFFRPTLALAGGQPAVELDLATGVSVTASFSTGIDGVTAEDGIDLASINTTTVRLIETLTGQAVNGFVNTDAVGSTITFTPAASLKAETGYTLVIDGVQTASGEDLIDTSHSFLTGVNAGGGDGEVAFAREEQAVSNFSPYSSLALSPDGTHLYATTLAGTIVRWDVDPDTGVLLNEQVFTTPELEGRALIGIAFDPNDPGVIWISNNAPLVSTDADDFTGKITRITLEEGPAFNAVAEDYIVGLPRSVRDHLANSLSFHDGKLYLNQGSNSATGAPDNVWGNRPERALSAAVLEIDTTRDISGGPINVQTQDPNVVLPPGAVGQLGYYNPYAAGAPVTLYATGIRNAYDLVWHSNGHLYVPANGSAAGGNTPDDPNTPQNEAIIGAGTQDDFLFDVEAGGYYGHPNPTRGEYILNGANPTSGIDPNEVPQYPVGTTPPADYGGFAYNFSRNRSPNGALEYLASTGAFGDALKNSLLVVEYSAGKDIVVLRFDANGDVLVDNQGNPLVETLTDARGNTLVFDNPLDIVSDANNGFIYVAQLNGTDGGQITLLRPTARDERPPEDRILEAEDAIIVGARIDDLPYGASGDEFVDFTNNVGAGESITWVFNVEEAGIYRISFRYSLSNAPKDADGRPLTLNVNGDNEATLVFAPSGANFRSWGFETYEVAFAVGQNSVRLTSIGTSGANIDYLGISPDPITALNTAPTIEGEQADLSFAQGSAISFAIRDVVIDDVDPGDVANYAARLKGGAPLPDWLNFEPGTQTFSSSGAEPPPAGVYEIELVANDGQDDSVAKVVFSIEIVRQFDPADVDGDGTLNAADNDDDDDGVPDGRDPFQSDPSNGGLTPLTEGRKLVFDFEDRPFGADPGYNGFGITGFKISGNRTPETLGLGSPNVSVVNGALHIENAGSGDLPSNNLTLGAQFAIDPIARFIQISATFDHPYDTQGPQRGANFGLVIGTGDNSDFVKLVLEGINGTGAFIQMETREGGVRNDALSPSFGRPSAALYRAADADDTVTFTFNIDTVAGTLTASWALRNGANQITGTSATITLSGDLLDAIRGDHTLTTNGGEEIASGLAIGVVASSRNAAVPIDIDVLDFTVEGFVADPDVTLTNPESVLLGARAIFNFIQDPTQNNGVGNPPREYHDTSVIRIRNDGTDVLNVTGMDLDGPFLFLDASDLGAFTLDAGQFRDIEVGFNNSPAAFDPEVSRYFEGELKVFSDDPDEAVAVADLAGYWNAVPEGGEEPDFNELMEVFGFGTRADIDLFDNFDLYQASSPDEILAPYFHIADGYSEVTVTQLAAFHDISQAALFLYEPGNGTDSETLGVLTHGTDFSQSILPTRTNGTAPTITFDASRWASEWAGDVFGFRVAGQYSDPSLNNDGPGQGPPGEQRGHFIRIFIAKDEAGNVIDDTYIIAQDYNGTNYDYQDNIYLVRGIEVAQELLIA